MSRPSWWTRRRRIAFFLTALVLAGGALSVTTLASGSTSAPIAGVPTLSQYYIVQDRAIVFPGASSWAGAWASVSNATQTYTNQFQIATFALTTYNVTLDVDLWEQGYGWVSNQSITILPGTMTAFPVTFVTNTAWLNFEIVFKAPGGAGPFPVMTGQVATPVSLLLLFNFNVGGLDLFAFIILSEAIIAFTVADWAAIRVQNRARWAPRFSLIVWGHVVIFGLLAAVIIDYQWIDQTFAGWSPVVYIFPVFLLMFASLLNRKNHGGYALGRQRVARTDGEIGANLWPILIDTLPDGRVIAMRETWGPSGWLGRAFGHYAEIRKADPLDPSPYEEIPRWMRSPTARPGRRRKRDPFARFQVVNPNALDVRVLWELEPGPEPVRITWPSLSFHRLKHIPAKLSKDGQTVIEAHDEPRLAPPHFTEAVVHSVALKPAHYKSAVAVQEEWATPEDLARVNSKWETAYHVLKGAFRWTVEAEVESRITSMDFAEAALTSPLTDEEAMNEAKRSRQTDTAAEESDVGRLKKPASVTP